MEPRKSRLVPVLELVAIAGVIAMWAMVAAYWSELPSRVPAHFGASGATDRWGGKNALFVLPVVGVVMYAGLTITSRLPQYFNLPPSVDSKHPAVLALMTELLVVTKTIAVLTFTYIEWASIQTALGQRNGLGRGFLPFAVSVAILAPILYIVKLRRYRA